MPGSLLRAAEVIPGRCHMDTCTWFSVEEKDLVGASTGGALFKVVTRGWQSLHPNGSYERRTPRRGGGSATQYVLCSKTQPAVLNETPARRWEVSELDLAPGSVPPGALETTTALYLAVCHAVAVPNTGEALTRFAQRFTYPATQGEPLPEEVTRPEDILRR